MIAERIKELREEKAWTQTELAKILGVTRSCVNAWEMGISVPSTQYVVELASLFHISTDFLLSVHFPPALLSLLPEDKRDAAIGVLSHDPRPSYQRSPERVYGLSFAGYDIRFTVEENILTVKEVLKK